MQEFKQNEIEHISSLCSFLSLQYPEYFTIGDYEHPLLGVRKTLIVQSHTFDIGNLKLVTLDFFENQITIKTIAPNKTFTIINFMKDETVV